MTRDQIVSALDAPFVMNLEARYGKDCDVLAVLERCLAINVATPYVNLRGACTQAVKNEARPRLLGVSVPPAPAAAPINGTIIDKIVDRLCNVARCGISPFALGQTLDYETWPIDERICQAIAKRLYAIGEKWPHETGVASFHGEE